MHLPGSFEERKMMDAFFNNQGGNPPCNTIYKIFVWKYIKAQHESITIIHITGRIDIHTEFLSWVNISANAAIKLLNWQYLRIPIQRIYMDLVDEKRIVMGY